MEKTNRYGKGPDGYNTFVLDDANRPGVKQKSEEYGDLLFYFAPSKRLVLPEMVGSVDNTTYNTHLGDDHRGFIGYKTREQAVGETLSHIIYTSSVKIKDLSRFRL